MAENQIRLTDGQLTDLRNRAQALADGGEEGPGTYYNGILDVLNHLFEQDAADPAVPWEDP